MPLTRNIIFDKDYGSLTEQGTLTMDSGEIKNSGSGYSIKDDGIEVRLSSGSSLDRERAYALVDGSGNVKGYIWGTTLDDSIRLVSEDNLVLEAKDGELLLGSTEVIRATAPVRLQQYTTAQINSISNPAIGMMVYNSSTGRLTIYNGSNWIYINGDGIN